MWTNPHHGKTHLGNSRKLKLVQTYTSSFSPEPCFTWFIVSMVISYQVVNFEQFSGQKKTLDGFISRVTSQSVSYLVYKESLKARSQLESAMTFGSLAIINFASSDYCRVS